MCYLLSIYSYQAKLSAGKDYLCAQVVMVATVVVEKVMVYPFEVRLSALREDVILAWYIQVVPEQTLAVRLRLALKTYISD